MKKSYPSQNITDLSVIEARLNSINLGGESSPIDADFNGIVSGHIQLNIYSGVTSKQSDGTDDETNLRPYEIGSLEIVGDVHDNSDNSTLTNKKVRISKAFFEKLKASQAIENGKVKDIPCKAEKWIQKRMVEGVLTDVERYRLVTAETAVLDAAIS